MESEQNINHLYDENKNIKEKTKSIPIHKQYLDDSETFENSLKYKTDNSIDEFNKKFKKSIDFLSKKIYLEEPELEEKTTSNRKYSMEQHLVIKDFVPQLKPIEIHLVPSKLRLNKKGFRDLKCNKDNKILLLSNNYFISCPNSEEESDISSSSEKYSPMGKNDDIKKTRKILQKMKSGSLPKVFSRNLIESNCKIYKDDMKLESDFEKEDSFDFDDNVLLFDDNDIFNNNITSFDMDNHNNNDKKENDEHEVNNNRINSCSILDVLKNRLSFDETN